MKIKVGDEVRDTITGFSGVVVCRSEWMYGCLRIAVQPRELKDGKPVEQPAATGSFDRPDISRAREDRR